MPIAALDLRRFNALAGYTRKPRLVVTVQEFDWLATADERVLGVLVWDRYDHDFGWIALAQDERFQYRAIDVESSLPSADAARANLTAAMIRFEEGPPKDLLQGEDHGPPVDFFELRVPEEEQHPSFRLLVSDPRYSPARELIAAMMRYHHDPDGNFVQQFQTTAFDARIWELYLFAVFTELGFAAIEHEVAQEVVVPDFRLSGLRGSVGVEATTVNPAAAGADVPRLTPENFEAYLNEYVPIKLGRALRRKLRKRPPYWEAPGTADAPFILAVQDFHTTGAMRMIIPAATEYAFGFRHSMTEDGRRIERLDQHVFGNMTEPSGFFRLPGAENIGAVIVNPQGTLLKFNRLGFLAGFGDRQVRMLRRGWRRHEGEADPRPRPFVDNVSDPEYRETWVEGMVVLHNPTAVRPLDPSLIPGATHETVGEDGRIYSLMPPEPPIYMSETAVFMEPDAGAPNFEPELAE